MTYARYRLFNLDKCYRRLNISGNSQKHLTRANVNRDNRNSAHAIQQQSSIFVSNFGKGIESSVTSYYKRFQTSVFRYVCAISFTSISMHKMSWKFMWFIIQYVEMFVPLIYIYTSFYTIIHTFVQVHVQTFLTIR